MTSSQVSPSPRSKMTRARRASSARPVRLAARRLSSVYSESVSLIAFLMDAIIVYNCMLRATSMEAPPLSRGVGLLMSREIGGRADKDGNEFERLWVTDQALRVLQGRATSLQWEPPCPTSFCLELEVGLPDGKREVHQCKIEKDLKGQWSAADLDAAGVLKAALRHLQRPSVSEFVFVSRDPAVSALRDLVERAHRMNADPELFFGEALSAREHQHEFQYLCKAWALDHNQAEDRARAFSFLQRLRFEVGIWDPSQRDRLERAAGLLAEGEGREIVSSLGSLLSSNLGKETYADDIRG